MGTPAAEGSFDITVAAGNSNGTGVKKISLAVTDFGKWPYSMDFTSKSLELSLKILPYIEIDETSGSQQLIYLKRKP